MDNVEEEVKTDEDELSSNNNQYAVKAETAADQEQVPLAEPPDQFTESQLRARLLAFYLPQYHSIPENDAWWGKGFTEWTNVSQGQPLFPAHYQPHIPADLGFYDLRLPQVRQAQADLARQYGIYGFCYYHYWFNGKQLLELPLEQVLGSGEPDFPFCLCWANENWTRRWDGEDDKTLIRQEYSEEDDLAHIRSLAAAFRDKRYIRVNSKPLFLVYNVRELPDPVRTTTIWREEALKMGFEGLYLCKVESRTGNKGDPAALGFDAGIEFPPHEFADGIPQAYPAEWAQEFEATILSYRGIVKTALQREIAEYKCFPGVMPSFDNTARRRFRPYIVQDSTPELYEQWLAAAVQRIQKAAYGPEENFVFINAWNEWGEGNHLEPDLRYGHAYLKATRRAVAELTGPEYWEFYEKHSELYEKHSELYEKHSELSEQYQATQAELNKLLDLKEIHEKLIRNNKKVEQDLDALSVHKRYIESQNEQLVSQIRQSEEEQARLLEVIQNLFRLSQQFEKDLRALQGTRSVRLTQAAGLIKQQWQKSFSTTAHLLAHPLISKIRSSVEGDLNLPLPQAECPGRVTVAGWAFSHSGQINQVEVWLDDNLIGHCYYGLARPDVLQERPWQIIQECGFQSDLDFDVSLTGLGSHQLRVIIQDIKGNCQEFNQAVLVTAPSVTLTKINPVQFDPYQVWIELNEPDASQLDRQRAKAAKLEYRPLVSIITPVFNTPPAVLEATIKSVQEQTYDNWELCLADASLDNPQLRGLLKKMAAADERIKVKFLAENQGIAANSNQALELASGEYITLLDHDDELAPNALYENVVLLNQHPAADMIYSDEDKMDEEGRRFDAFFKPEWSPELFLSMMYTSHLGVYRASLIKEIGGFRPGFEGAQDYDLVLRVIERTQQIYHIPRVLYHWRTLPNSTAARVDAKEYARQSQIKAVRQYCQRTGLAEQVEPGLASNTLRVCYNSQQKPLVTIIIPTRDQVEVLRRAIDSIKEHSNYPNYEIMVVDNDSSERATLNYFEELKRQPNSQVLAYPHPFNFSAINNFAARQARGELLLFLNNDVEVITPNWLDALVEQAVRPEIGAVGARLLYPNGTLQHGGVILGIGGVAGHAHKYLPANQPGYFSRALAIQNFSAVTAACLMIKASLFNELGGFDEKNLAIAFNDVDLCLRVRERGLRIVWTPYAELYHYESLSRGHENSPKKIARFQREIRYMQQRWSHLLNDDPYYNPNLSLDREDFALDLAPRVPGD